MLIYGVTFDCSTNYGSCYQAFALQTAIEKTVVAGEPCRYKLIPARRFSVFRSRKVLSKKIFIKKLLIGPVWSLHRLQFRAFDKKHMHYADVKDFSKLPSLNADADAFVCGSDVIWNPDQNEHNFDYYFLNFASKYKFSYAASFGKAEFGESYYPVVRRYLNSFQAISVREQSSRVTAEKCTEKPVSVVLDPVLLLTQNEWNAILPAKTEMGEHIFVYETHFNETIHRFVEKLQRETNRKVIFHTTGPKQSLKKGKLQVAKPEIWLEQLRSAAFVITNSFHATAFSILFHKRFYTVVNGNKAAGINVRMNDLLNTVGLPDRIFSSVPQSIDLGDIDFSQADETIASLRADSLAFLQRNLDVAYQEKIKNESEIKEN